VTLLVLHVLLWLDGFPWFPIGMGILSHIIYAWMFADFPFVTIISPQTFLALIAFVASHVYWSLYFINESQAFDHHHDSLYLVGFFLLMVWMFPVGLFISLSRREDSLPSVASGPGSNRFNNNSYGINDSGGSIGGGSGTSGLGGPTRGATKGNIFRSMYTMTVEALKYQASRTLPNGQSLYATAGKKGY
jgi:Transmembrane adaptor Erv26